MLIRIHDTDFDGRPVPFTGEYIHGDTAADVVMAMKQNPFTQSLGIGEYMRATLDRIGIGAELPEHDAAEEFLRLLTLHGYVIDAQDEQHALEKMQMK